MGNKTITMSYEDYQMISTKNELYKQQYEELKQEKMVFLTLGTHVSHISQMSGQIVEKDKVLKKMQEHLADSKRRFEEREANYERRIERLKEELYQASINQVENVVTKWWHKLLK